MRGKRLRDATIKAEHTFEKYQGYNPRDEKLLTARWIPWTEDEIARTVGIFRKTKVPCSCVMCGNPRRYFGELTFGEIRQHLDADAQCEEVDWYHKKVRWSV